NVKQKVSESAEEAGSESDDILLNLKEQSADLSNRFKKTAEDLKKPADELGSIAKDTSEDIMIDVKDAADKAGETVNEGMSE
ncbi:YtxH domain-containing protein, partial [Enterococcus faecium]